jgi:hypothetical protein
MHNLQDTKDPFRAYSRPQYVDDEPDHGQELPPGQEEPDLLYHLVQCSSIKCISQQHESSIPSRAVMLKAL